MKANWWAMKFYIDTYGCAKNQVDSEYLITLLKAGGLEYTSDAKEADLILVNSCGFLDSSKKESIDALKYWQKDYPTKTVILCGCLPQVLNIDKSVKKRLPSNIKIVGNDDIKRCADNILQMLPNTNNLKGSCCDNYIGRDVFLGAKNSCYVKIAEGCSNHCAFCAIPLIRGELKSRSLESVVSEISNLVSKNTFELNLVAQDLGSFGRDIGGRQLLGDLLKQISQVTGNFWVRLLYIHPDNFPSEIIDICKKDRRILPYFDIPFQSGSSKIISAMGRHGQRGNYIEFIRKLKSELPDCVLRTTIMVGFPGETDEDFLDTFNFLKEIAPLWSGNFIFNAQKGTSAFDMPHNIDSAICAERVAQLQKLQEQITSHLLEGYVGKTLDIFIEDTESTGIYFGRAWFCAPDVDGCVIVHSKKPLAIGSVKKALVTGVAGFDLIAVAL